MAIRDADIKLLFGVATGGAYGDSAELIKKQLKEIMSKITVGVTLNTRNFHAQINKGLKAANDKGDFSVKISEIKVGSGAISAFKKKLSDVINTLNLDKGVSVTLSSKEIGKVAGNTKEIKRQTEAAAKAAAEYKVQMAAIDERSKNIKNNLKSAGSVATTSEQTDIAAIQAQYDAWLVRMETARGMGVSWTTTQRADILSEAAAIQDNIAALMLQQQARIDDAAAAEAQAAAVRDAAAAEATKADADAREAAEFKKKNSLLSQSQALLTKIEEAETKWTAASSGRSKESYERLKQLGAELRSLRDKYRDTNSSSAKFEANLTDLNRRFKEYSADIRSAGENTKTFGERVKGLADKFTSWLTVSQIIMLLYRSMREMVKYVVDIDTAMTELKKVTDETSSTYTAFLDDAIVRAKKLGATIADTVNASADFARLGYTLDESAQLADAALVYKNVGDGIEDIGEASESIISTMKAFNVEASRSIEIVDKFNEVGNRFPISSQGIGEALRRSASALAAANNTIDESIALITAANSVVQDPDVVGTTMKTLSMYLRAAKTEAEEAGESTEGMANSVSELRDEILSLTGNRVDIQLDDNTFKNTYQVMKELSVVWDDLTDISRANILEQIAGKRNANAVSALLENFDIAEGALEAAADSAGSAMAENEKYLDSINGKVAKFKATLEQLSNTLIGSDFIKQIVDVGTALLDVLNVLAKIVDALGGLGTVLATTIGMVGFIKAGAIGTKLKKIADSIKGIGTAIKGIDAAYQAAYVSGKGLASSNGTLQSSFAGVKAGLKGVASSAYAVQAAFGAIAIVTAIVGAAFSAYEKHKQKLEEQRAAARDTAEAYDETSKSLDEYKTRIVELRTAISENNLSEQDAYDKRKELLSIQDELIGKFGKEAEGINLVTGSINDQIDAIDALNKASYKEWEQSNSASIRDAKSLFTDFSFKKLDPWGATDQFSIVAPSSSELWSAIEKSGVNIIPRDFHDELEKRLLNAGLGIEIPVTGVTGDFMSDMDISDIYSALDAYQNLYDIVAGVGKEFFGPNYLDYIGDALSRYSDKINDIKGAIEDNETTFNVYAEGVLNTDARYSEIWSGILAAQKKYNDAILSGDEDATAKAIAQMKSLQEESLSAGWDDDAVNLYVKNLFDKFNSATKDYSFEIEIKASLSDDTNELGKQIKDALKAFENSLGTVDLFRILNVGLDQTGVAQDEIDAYNSLKLAAREYGMEVEDLCNVLVKLGYVQGDITSASYTNPLDFSDFIGELDEAKNGLDSIIAAMDKLRSGTAMTKQELANLALQYPKLLEESQLFTDNSIDGQKRILDTILDVKEKEYDAKLDEKIAELKASEQLIQDQIDIEQQKAEIIAEIENATVNGRIKQEYALAERLSDLNDLEGQNFVSLEDGILQVNSDALTEKLRQDIDYAQTADQSVWTPIQHSIEDSHTVGLQNSLNSIDAFNTKAAEKASGYVTDVLVPFSKAYSLAEQGADPSAYARSIIAGAKQRAQSSSNSIGTVHGALFGAVSGALAGDLWKTTIDNLGIDKWISQQEKRTAERISMLTDLKDRTVNARKNLEKLKGLDLTGIYGSAGKGSSSSSSTKTIEEYIADIDKYYEAVKRLEAAQERSNSLSKKIKYTEDTAEKIKLSSALIDAYREEADAERNLMALKRQTISDNAAALRRLGFEVEYNSESNELLIKNQEHLNDLTASSAGKYNTLQEATNALRKETEDLIKATEQLNDDNINAASSIEDLGYSIQDTKNDIVDYIEDVYGKQVDAYQEVINKRKELLESAKDELSYEEEVAEKVKEIADLQTRIDQLSLDDSRSARAERASLMEELKEKQKDLANTQRDHSIESQTDALDKMADDYESEKNAELELIRKTVNESDELWSAFYDTLLGKNVTIGESINENVANAWINAARAVNEYSASVQSIGGVGTVVSNIPKYHSGGVVDESNLGKDEALAILQKGEVVLNERKQTSLYRIIDFQEELSKRLGVAIGELRPSVPSIDMSGLISRVASEQSAPTGGLIFEPHIEVNISHSGGLDMSQAEAYGDKIASVAIDKLYSAFERRGISSTRGARLKP